MCMESLLFALLGAVIATLLGVLVNFVAKPPWAAKYPGRVVAAIAGLAVVGALVSVGASAARERQEATREPRYRPVRRQPRRRLPQSPAQLAEFLGLPPRQPRQHVAHTAHPALPTTCRSRRLCIEQAG